MSEATTTIKCAGCGADVPDIVGPTHAYIGASPGCWKVYGDVLAREYGEYGYPECHRLTIDAYAAQHPGTPSRRSIQSVAGHLIALHVLFEQNVSAAEATRRIGAAVAQAESFHWLEPPSFADAMTVLDVAATADLETHQRVVRAWAESVWHAWSEHHETVKLWARM
ncbi:MAG: hypothetical protein H6815_01370 [Phycisphaeraceae bacterium]|nr:hypothetical protein [Phycisphaerales bacterium]MCB9859077.1 hypothetical protein [Phycisphaeraceae bacterium]